MTDLDDSVVSEEGESTSRVGEHDPYFEPVVTLLEVFVVSDDDQEEEMIRLSFEVRSGSTSCFIITPSESPPQWKERGMEAINILRNKQKKAVEFVQWQN
ncbi:ran-specific GTPase-activating protein-like isoform X2 [Scylla paramamosain]|uniref:ran-specific GTPase-activating protein-like isoform X2 n=1 Tax=Scylla paramamosain TaxID=85552 RepID=UPI00308363F1